VSQDEVGRSVFWHPTADSRNSHVRCRYCIVEWAVGVCSVVAEPVLVAVVGGLAAAVPLAPAQGELVEHPGLTWAE
jgi:hypothetical protein